MYLSGTRSCKGVKIRSFTYNTRIILDIYVKMQKSTVMIRPGSYINDAAIAGRTQVGWS